MGDIPLQPGAPTDFPRQNVPPAPVLGSGPITQANYPQGQVVPDYSSGYPPIIQQHYGASPAAFSSQLDMAQAQGPTRNAGPYNMNGLASALPQMNYRPGQYSQGQQRFTPATASPTVAGQVPMPQYGVQGTMGAVANQSYYMPQQAQMPQYYATPISPTQQTTNVPPRASVGYYPNPMVMGQQPQPSGQFYYTQVPPYPGQVQNMQAQMVPGQYMSPSLPPTDRRLVQSQTSDQTLSSNYLLDQGSPTPDGRSGVVRGPPRKPRQSGHAIWIGNLPPQTDLMSLVHHVCKETNGLESLFLISKSNCAFANFKDEATCVTAQQQLHDSKFQSVRLVSRLRKSTVEGASGVTAPTGPAAATPQSGAAVKAENTGLASVDGENVVQPPVTVELKTPPAPEEPVQKDKFFILKSLTAEDLELSVRTNIWATQSHNEETLNKAFKAVDNVYLIFSANKSGEYFGYARMVSPINEDPAAAIEFAPKAQSTSDLDLPKAIPTEATEFAPKGRIIDDSARGTIFWEAEREDSALPDGAVDDDALSGGASVGGDSNSANSGQEGSAGENKAWGKPFRLEWLSTTRLPFYRTRGLRNPWNSNREVKIARDGTELEPSVGRRLIGLFNRVQSPAPGMMPGMAPGGMRGPGPVAMMAGYPPMRAPFM